MLSTPALLLTTILTALPPMHFVQPQGVPDLGDLWNIAQAAGDTQSASTAITLASVLGGALSPLVSATDLTAEASSQSFVHASEPSAGDHALRIQGYGVGSSEVHCCNAFAFSRADVTAWLHVESAEAASVRVRLNLTASGISGTNVSIHRTDTWQVLLEEGASSYIVPEVVEVNTVIDLPAGVTRIAIYGSLQANSGLGDEQSGLHEAIIAIADPADLNASGAVDFTDLLTILGSWGAPTPATESFDLDADGAIGFGDMLIVLAGWTSGK